VIGTVRRLNNAKVCNLNDHRLNIDQEECTKWLFNDVVQAFGYELALIGLGHFPTDDGLRLLLATPTPLIQRLLRCAKFLLRHP